jgi:hypothetical protein
LRNVSTDSALVTSTCAMTAFPAASMIEFTNSSVVPLLLLYLYPGNKSSRISGQSLRRAFL